MSAGWPYRCTGMMARGARRDGGFDLGRVEIVGIGADVHKDRRGAGLGDGLGGGVEGERGGDHLVAGADAAGQQRQVQRRRARGHPDGFADADEAGEGFLECPDLGPHDEAACAPTTRWMAASTSGLMAAYWAFKSTTGMRLLNAVLPG